MGEEVLVTEAGVDSGAPCSGEAKCMQASRMLRGGSMRNVIMFVLHVCSRESAFGPAVAVTIC